MLTVFFLGLCIRSVTTDHSFFKFYEMSNEKVKCFRKRTGIRIIDVLAVGVMSCLLVGILVAFVLNGFSYFEISEFWRFLSNFDERFLGNNFVWHNIEPHYGFNFWLKLDFAHNGNNFDQLYIDYEYMVWCQLSDAYWPQWTRVWSRTWI